MKRLSTLSLLFFVFSGLCAHADAWTEHLNRCVNPILSGTAPVLNGLVEGASEIEMDGRLMSEFSPDARVYVDPDKSFELVVSRRPTGCLLGTLTLQSNFDAYLSWAEDGVAAGRLIEEQDSILGNAYFSNSVPRFRLVAIIDERMNFALFSIVGLD